MVGGGCPYSAHHHNEVTAVSLRYRKADRAYQLSISRIAMKTLEFRIGEHPKRLKIMVLNRPSQFGKRSFPVA